MNTKKGNNSFKLDDNKKANVDFKVPDKYFDELPLQIQKRIELTESKSPSMIRLLKWYLAPSLAIATVLVLWFGTTGQEQWQQTANELADAQQIIEECSDEDLATFVEEEELTEYDISEEDDIIDYVVQHNIEVKFDDDDEDNETSSEGQEGKISEDDGQAEEELRESLDELDLDDFEDFDYLDADYDVDFGFAG